MTQRIASATRMWSACLALLALAAPVAAQDEGGEPWVEEYDVREFTCPVGGEAFTQDVGYFAYPLETLPDGSWLGDILIDAQIPQCPGNGLLILPDYHRVMEEELVQGMVYHDYSAAELAQLPALIADPQYAALKADGRHAQAYWLATRLERPALDRFALLQRATWAALAPDLRQRLVAKFVAEGPALIAASEMPEEWQRFQTGYVVNGLRELGRFDEALALLDRLEAGGWTVYAPADAGDIFAADLTTPMRLAIAGKDDGRFPIELLDSRMVGTVCDEHDLPPFDHRTPGTLAACETRRAREAREADEREAAFAEADILREDLPALERRCGETAPDARTGGLRIACSSLEWDRDDKAADDLLLNHARQVSEDCERVPKDEHEGPLRFACIGYESAVESAVTELLTDDDEAYAIVCAGGGKGDGTQDITEIQRLCSGAERNRNAYAEEALLADLPALDAQCAATAEDDREIVLYSACSQRGFDLEREAQERVAGDPQELARRCGNVGEQDYESMSKAEFDVARFCAEVREVQLRAEERAAGLECYEGWAGDGEDEEFSVERQCFPLEESAAVPDDQTPSPSHHDDDSELSQIARERAAQVVAEARAEAESP